MRMSYDSEEKRGAFLAGVRLVWKRQRILWWIFVVNFAFSFAGVSILTHNVADDAGLTLNHSTEAARRLVHGFDVTALMELSSLPQQPLRGGSGLAMWPTVLFAIFMLFATGGILVSYWDDLQLDAAGFFEACGSHFWRFVRLVFYFAIAMIPVGILCGIAGKIYDHIEDVSVSPYASVWFACGALAVILFVVMSIRLWFDMAQVIAVAVNERRMHKALRMAAKVVRRNFGGLFWLFLRINVVGWAVFAAGLYIWMVVLRPESIWKGFLTGELIVLFGLGTRLWTRASEAVWYRRYEEPEAVRVVRPGELEPAAPAEAEPELVGTRG